MFHPIGEQRLLNLPARPASVKWSCTVEPVRVSSPLNLSYAGQYGGDQHRARPKSSVPVIAQVDPHLIFNGNGGFLLTRLPVWTPLA